MKAKIIIVAVLIALIGGGIAGYRHYTAQETAAEKQIKETETVERRDLLSVVSATGTITPESSVEVSAKSTARVTRILVKENDTVTAGQIVATLDGKDYEAKRDQARYRVQNTKSKYERTAYLYSIGAKSAEELEDALYNYETAESNLVSAESDVNNMIIVAPMDGVVVGEPVTVGTMAVQGSSYPTVIMRIADLSRKQILAKVDETDIGAVKVGQQATFTVDAFGDRKFNATVSKISQTDTSNTWNIHSSSNSSSSSSSASVIYYYVTLNVDDPEGILLPAMTARLDISTARREKALSVPITALKTDKTGTYVILVKDNGETENRYVTLGIYADEYVEILDGLNEGDVISMDYAAAAKNQIDEKKK